MGISLPIVPREFELGWIERYNYYEGWFLYQPKFAVFLGYQFNRIKFNGIMNFGLIGGQDSNLNENPVMYESIIFYSYELNLSIDIFNF